MRMTTLVKLFKEKNPEGSIWKARTRANRFRVSYGGEGSRVYTYYATTVIEMAGRLDLVPEVDVWKESDRIIRELIDTGESIGPYQCSDTVRHVLYDQFKRTKTLEVEFAHMSEFEVEISIYTLVDGDKYARWRM